jgi:hypothetical protein
MAIVKSSGARPGEIEVMKIANKNAKQVMMQNSETRKAASRTVCHFAWLKRNPVTMTGLLMVSLLPVARTVTVDGAFRARIIRSVDLGCPLMRLV